MPWLGQRRPVPWRNGDYRCEPGHIPSCRGSQKPKMLTDHREDSYIQRIKASPIYLSLWVHKNTKSELTGHYAEWLLLDWAKRCPPRNVISRYVCRGCFWKRLASESMDWVDGPSQVGGPHQTRWGPEGRTKVEEGQIGSFFARAGTYL